MDTALIGRLIQLRYQLLWAKTRSRNGRIALFFTGYLLVILLLILLGMGGIGTAIVAVRTGKAELVAQAVLGGLFLQAIIATNIIGFGMSAVFSDTELRRYPLSAVDRRVTRHLSSLLDPFWFLVLALGLGLAVGLYAMGPGNLALGLAAVLLLFVANYLLARIIAVCVDRMMATKGGAAILIIPILMLSIGPSIMAPIFQRNPGRAATVLAWLGYTPPFGAAAAMTHADSAGLRGLGVVLIWIAGLAAILIRMEQRPPQRHTAVSSKIAWEGPFDRIGAWFGPALAPLVAHWLCFFCRNQKTRTITLMSLPLLGFLTWQTGSQIARHRGPVGFFVAAMGTFPAIAFMGISRMAVNPFGYTGGAFRRYFLLPLNPADILRSASYAALTLGAAMLPIAALAWLALSPLRADLRFLFMLLCSGIGGMFLVHGLGVWVTLYNPRKADYASKLGNDLSLSGNILLIGSIFGSMLFPRLVNFFYPALFSPANWWMLVPLPILGFLFYRISLNAAGPLFNARREKLLAVVEGRN